MVTAVDRRQLNRGTGLKKPGEARPLRLPRRMSLVVQLRAGEVVCKRIYWDQASVLVQLGLLDPSHLPVAGADTARKVLNPELPCNELIRRVAE
jgi:carboxymethylenebutenolidase